MSRQLLLFALLFAAGIGFGMLVTPVGVAISEQVRQPEPESPDKRRPQSHSEPKTFYS